MVSYLDSIGVSMLIKEERDMRQYGKPRYQYSIWKFITNMILIAVLLTIIIKAVDGYYSQAGTGTATLVLPLLFIGRIKKEAARQE